MSSNLQVLKEERWFLRTPQKQKDGAEQNRNYGIDYRYSVCYSLLHYLNCGHNKDQGKEVITNLYNSVKEKKTWQEKEFVELIPLADNLGHVAIDKADGMYPLILYANRKRDYAYERSVKDLLDNYETIYDCLKDHSITDWTWDFQVELSKKVPFNYKEAVERTASQSLY